MQNLSLLDPFAFTDGPKNAETLIVGESWGEMEEAKKLPFVGGAGKELDTLLTECGIDPRSCLKTNVFNLRPPQNEMWRRCVPVHTAEKSNSFRGLDLTPDLVEHIEKLYRLIATLKPKRILAFGNYAFWALSSEARIAYSEDKPVTRVPSGIGSFRGSMLFVDVNQQLEALKIHLLPLVHPAAYMRNWEMRAPTVHDLRTRMPLSIRNDWVHKTRQIIHRPTFYEMFNFFKSRISKMDSGHKLYFANDIETRRHQITCHSFSDSPNFAIVMPFISRITPTGAESYWTIQQEMELTKLMSRMMTHPNAMVIGQNYIYDTWYFHRLYNLRPRLRHDTLIAQHLIWPGTPKDLGYLSSIYCKYHRYWKDDNKEWSGKDSIDNHLRYNGEDSMRTFEIAFAQKDVIKQVGKESLWDLEMKKNDLAFEMSVRGVLIDQKAKAKVSRDLADAADERIRHLLGIFPQESVNYYIGKQKTAWVTSPKQQKLVFGDILQMSIPTNRKTGNPSLDKESLAKLKVKYPHFALIFNVLLELRSIKVFKSTFADALVDPDNRMRTSFNPGGTETFRWSSQTNPFDTGCNFQNLPQGNEE